MSYDIMPLGTRCHDFEWRLNLKPGDQIDCSDTSNVWYRATVLQRNDGVQDIPHVKVGYRTYTEDGDKIDDDDKAFTGWSPKYDEWFPVTTTRIAKPRTHAFKFFAVVSTRADPVVDDSNDILFKEEGYMKFAIISENRTTSSTLVKMVNKFG
jgi:hypothetical protein